MTITRPMRRGEAFVAVQHDQLFAVDRDRSPLRYRGASLVILALSLAGWIAFILGFMALLRLSF